MGLLAYLDVQIGHPFGVRSFIAVALPESVVTGLVGVQRAIEAGAPGFYRWVGEENAHLTLYFLGESSEAEIEAVRSALLGVSFSPFSIQIEGLALIPEPTSPRIVVAGIGGDLSLLTRFQQRISDTVFPLAAFKETRRYYPHVTLGRLKHGLPSNAKQLKRTLADVAAPLSPPFVVDSFELIKSGVGPGGPRYETVHRFGLS